MNADHPEDSPRQDPLDFDTLLPDDENGRLLRQMRLSGVNVDQHHTIDFFFEFHGEANAAAFHREENEAWATDFCYPVEGRWMVRVSKSLIPTHRAINELQEKLIHIASLHHGKAAGWSYSPE